MYFRKRGLKIYRLKPVLLLKFVKNGFRHSPLRVNLSLFWLLNLKHKDGYKHLINYTNEMIMVKRKIQVTFEKCKK